MLLGCYRRDDANNPEIYSAAVASVLAEYERDVIAYVTDPRTGLPSSCSFLPTIKEVRDACMARVKAKELLAKPAFRVTTFQPRGGFPPPGQDYYSMVEKYGRPIGRFEEKPLALPKTGTITPDQAKAALGASDQQWAEIPDASDYDFKRLDPKL